MKDKNVCPTLEISKAVPISEADDPEQKLTTVKVYPVSAAVPSAKDDAPQTLSRERTNCTPLMDITFSNENVLSFKQYLQEKYHRTASATLQFQPVHLVSIIFNLSNLILLLTRQFNLPFPLPYQFPQPYPF